MNPVIETLSRLVEINSINPEWAGPGEREAATFVREFFERAGIEVWEEEVLPNRPNIIARLPGVNPDRRIVLEAHMDVVSVADMTIPPFEPRIEDGLLYGRGSCDTKAGLAAMMQAMVALKESGQTPPCDIWLGAVVDEEHAYRGVVSLIETLEKTGPTPEAAVVAEPTQLRVVRANKGALRWKIATRGVSAHSSKPHLGKSAITAMAKVVLALEADEQLLAKREPHPLVGPPTCSIGVIAGGAQVNFVPEHCEITLDRRMLPGETAEGVIAHYEHLLDRVRSENPDIDVKIQPPYLADEAMETPADAEVVNAMSRVLAELGHDPEPCGVPFGCDCSKLSRAGIPSVIFGPGSIDQAHGAVEFVEIKQVEAAFEFYKRFLMEFGSDSAA
ncbi:MAG: acetylornithine deacetylase/succinyl-diaminopimelate desuccinylase family protein [Verrucomicrobiales bacterium]|jgi:acetylornithine deacetylase/succinyl-diaminopimelate desuccinylase family protein